MCIFLLEVSMQFFIYRGVTPLGRFKATAGRVKVVVKLNKAPF